jgi:Ring finger domain
MAEAPDIVNMIHQINSTSREFYRTVRFLTGDTRNQIALAHERNTSLMLSLLRTAHIVNQPVRYTVNIPLNMNSTWLDLSGNNFLEPVPVVPTQEQIASATDRHVGVTDTVCSICQENVTCATRIRRCGHCFHSDCISQWFTMNPRCPMCRIDIREAENTLGERNIVESILRNIGAYESNDNRRNTDEE